MGSVHSTALESVRKGDVQAIRELLQRSDVKEWINKRLKGNHGSRLLHEACNGGNRDIVKFLLKSRAFVDVPLKNDLYNYPLNIAFKMGHFSVVEVFIEMELKGQLSYQHRNGRSLLHVACDACHVDTKLVRRLLDAGLDGTKLDKNEKAPVDYVSDEWRKKDVFCLIYHPWASKHINTEDVQEVMKVLKWKNMKSWINRKDDMNVGRTPLHETIKSNNLEVTKLLLASGADVNSADNNGETCINLAIVNGHLEMVKLLFTSGADIGRANNYEITPLHWACSYGRLEVVKLFLFSGADISCTDKDRWTPLHWASDKGHLEVVKHLLSSGADINSSDYGGYTPLHCASENGHLEVVKLLIASDADVNCSENWGKTPLYVASSYGRSEVVQYLLSSGADINGTDEDGSTSLHVASRFGHLEVVRCLLSSGAIVRSTDSDGKTALHVPTSAGHLKRSLEIVDPLEAPIGMAFREGHSSVVEVFIEMELRGELCHESGGSLLHVVCREKKFKVDLLKRLLAAGVDTAKRDKRGNLPVDYLSKEWQAKVSPLFDTMAHEDAASEVESDVETEDQLTQMVGATSLTNINISACIPQDGPSETLLPPCGGYTVGCSSLSFSYRFSYGGRERRSACSHRESSLGARVVAVQDVKLGEVIGRGAFGKVFKGECDFQDVAVKVFQCGSDIPKEVAEQVRQEVRVMCRLSHPNIVRLYGLVEREDSPPMLVMDFGAGGSLYSHLRHSSYPDRPYSHRLRIAFELSRGLAYLHKMNVVHRDIKSLNVILDEFGRPMWCDFGLSVTKEHVQTATMAGGAQGDQDRDQVAGTLRWLAPEQFSFKHSTPSRVSDVWSLGMVFFEIASQQVPYSRSTNKDVIKDWIKTREGEEVPEECQAKAPVLADLMRRCWSERSARPSAADIAVELKAVV